MPEQRRFARSRRADQGNYLAGPDAERHVVQSLAIAGESFAEAVDCDRRHGSAPKVLRIMPCQCDIDVNDF